MGNEMRYLEECIQSNFVSSIGPFVDRFEQEFAAYVGSRHAIACASGTAALHVALLVAGARPDTDVPVSTFTFLASVNAIAYTGATPLLVDSEPRTWNLDGERLHDEVIARAARGGALPSVIEVVHILGHPADLEPLLDLRDRFGIPLVEDAAEALGATYESGALAGRHVGSIGDLGCFSFNGNKILTTGGGGIIVTDDDSLAHAARHLTTQAKLPGLAYVHDRIGFNYRMSNVSAALGLAQLEQLGQFLEAKRSLACRYDSALESCEYLQAPPCASWAAPSRWLYSVLCRSHDLREHLLATMAADGVDTRPVWVPAHLQAPYAATPRLGGECAEDLSRRGLSLPSSVGLSEDDQRKVVAALLRDAEPAIS